MEILKNDLKQGFNQKKRLTNCCTASYIGLPTRQLRKRIKEHVQKSVDNFCCLGKKDDIPAKFKRI